MTPRKPEDWPRLFEQHLNAGQLEDVVSLYDPDACFVPRVGDTIVGRKGLRRVLADLIDHQTQLHSRVTKSITGGDIAVLYTDFDGTTLDASGKTVEVHHKAIEILRRQPDG